MNDSIIKQEMYYSCINRDLVMCVMHLICTLYIFYELLVLFFNEEKE